MCVTEGEGYSTGRGKQQGGASAQLALSVGKATSMCDAPVRPSGWEFLLLAFRGPTARNNFLP